MEKDILRKSSACFVKEVTWNIAVIQQQSEGRFVNQLCPTMKVSFHQLIMLGVNHLKS